MTHTEKHLANNSLGVYMERVLGVDLPWCAHSKKNKKTVVLDGRTCEGINLFVYVYYVTFYK